MPLPGPIGTATRRVDAVSIWGGAVTTAGTSALAFYEGYGVTAVVIIALAVFPLAFLTAMLVPHRRAISEKLTTLFTGKNTNGAALSVDKETTGLSPLEVEWLYKLNDLVVFRLARACELVQILASDVYAKCAFSSEEEKRIIGRYTTSGDVTEAMLRSSFQMYVKIHRLEQAKHAFINYEYYYRELVSIFFNIYEYNGQKPLDRFWLSEWLKYDDEYCNGLEEIACRPGFENLKSITITRYSMEHKWDVDHSK